MTVRRILEEKGRNVLTTGPDATLHQVASMLSEHHVGALIIVDFDQHIAGIVAERDIVGNIAKFGPDCLEEPVSSIMWKNVYRCSEETTVGELMELMSKHRARHIPVEKHGKLVGIVSIGDVVQAHIREIKSETEHIKAYISG